MKFGIIGQGRFGKLWNRILSPHGEVVVFDEPLKEGSLADVLNVDWLWLAVPISEMEACCQAIAPRLLPRTIVADVCSVKMRPAELMQAILPPPQALIATHPLFGPDSVARMGLPGRKIVLCPLRLNSGQLAVVKNLCAKLQLEIVISTPEEHDRQMARSQALVHFIGRGLGALSLAPQSLSTPDYQALLAMNTMVEHDTWQLFFDLERYNPYAREVRERFLAELEQLEERIASNSDNEVGDVRKRIDEIDIALWRILVRRFALARQVGQSKIAAGKAIEDMAREDEVRRHFGTLSATHGISEAFVEELSTLLFREAKRIQQEQV